MLRVMVKCTYTCVVLIADNNQTGPIVELTQISLGAPSYDASMVFVVVVVNRQFCRHARESHAHAPPTINNLPEDQNILQSPQPPSPPPWPINSLTARCEYSK